MIDVTATNIEAAIRSAATPADAARSVLALIDAGEALDRHGMAPQNWERMIAGSMTGLVFQGLTLKLAELEKLVREDGLEEWVRQSREYDRDCCIEAIEHVAGPGRARLASDAIELVRRDLDLTT